MTKNNIVQEVKIEQNTPLTEIDFIKNPATRTIIDRYIIASQFFRDKKVLDLGCGYGIGSMLLYALGAKRVFGMDIDKKAMKFAHKRYQMKEIHFRKLDVLTQELYKDSFDGACTIELFEHIEREETKILLTKLKNTVIKDGIIFITTPKRKIPVWNVVGGTHKYEYTFQEFKDELLKFWKEENITFYGIIELGNNDYPPFNSTSMICPISDKIMGLTCVLVAVIKNDK